jgi:hypothetical protein
MQKELTRDQIEAQLRGKTDQIGRRVDALQSEVSTVGQALREGLLKNPLIALGGVVLAGLLVGLLVGGRRKAPRAPKSRDPHRRLVDEYIESISEDATRRMEKGKASGEAVRAALRDRVPLIVYAPGGREEESGLVRKAVGMAASTAAGLALKVASDFLTQRLAMDGAVHGGDEPGPRA